MELEHNHDKPNIDGKYKCPACDAIKQNLQPHEDGFYQYEYENKLFVSTYYRIWNELES